MIDGQIRCQLLLHISMEVKDAVLRMVLLLMFMGVRNKLFAWFRLATCFVHQGTAASGRAVIGSRIAYLQEAMG